MSISQQLQTRKFYIESLGCAKNQVDSEQIGASLMQDHWEWTDDIQQSELIIVNTCGFIQSAKEESIDVLVQMQQHYPGKKIIASGCLVERYSDELPKAIPELDGFLGARAPERIRELVQNDFGAGVASARQQAPVFVPPTAHPQLRRSKLLSPPGSAYVKIAEGCSHNCSFCAIPQFKGRLNSRPIAAIVAEIASLLQQGIREIILISQDTAGYGSDWLNFAEQRSAEQSDGGSEDAVRAAGQLHLTDLIRAILDLEGHFWLRLLYIHPDIFPYDLLQIMQQDSRLLPYFDVPLQHVSKKQLRAMNRRGDYQLYAQLFQRIRRELPQAVIRSTYLTGFPGETQQDYQDFLRFQQEVGIDWLGVFTYSREEGTEAFERHSLFATLQRRAAQQRKKHVEERQLQLCNKSMQRFLGREIEVLIEERYEDQPLSLGRCYVQAPEVDGSVLLRSNEFAPGQLVWAKVLKVNGFDLEARPVSRPVEGVFDPSIGKNG